jgi:alpha-tubulin suppressor-like RCC1 family protein
MGTAIGYRRSLRHPGFTGQKRTWISFHSAGLSMRFGFVRIRTGQSVPPIACETASLMKSPVCAALLCLAGLSAAATPYGVGRNDYSPLGDGTMVYRSVPAPVLTEPDRLPISGVMAIASGTADSVLVKTDGTAWIAGGAANIAFGIGSAPRQILARQILETPGGAPFTGATAVDCGSGFSLLLKTDGTVSGFGANGSGQLGDGTTVSRSDPGSVLISAGGPPLSGVAAIAAGKSHSVFLKSDGSVWACGGNSDGQLGDGTTTSRSVPVQVLEASGGTEFTGVSAIAAGTYHSILLKSDGTVWTMGENASGQLGDGTTTERNTPVQVLESPAGPAFAGVMAVQAGDRHSLLLKSDGSVWAMGSNSGGRLGDGTTLNRTTPVRVLDAPGGSPFTDAAAIGTGDSHSLLLRNDGTAWAWGSNLYCQLGDGGVTDRNVPVPVKAPGGGSLEDVVAVAGGVYHSLFLKSDGTVLAAGWNLQGQLGDGVLQHHATSPVAMRSVPDGPPMRNVIAVASGKVHALILKADGSLWSTGSNGHGQLGNGPIRNNQQHLTPGPVLTAEGGPQVTDVIAIAAGTYHSVFVKSDGSLWAFGENEGGQLGDLSTTDRAYPVPVLSAVGGPQVTGVTAISAGHLHTVFLKNDGSPWAVGSNGYGQLGNGSLYRLFDTGPNPQQNGLQLSFQSSR